MGSIYTTPPARPFRLQVGNDGQGNPNQLNEQLGWNAAHVIVDNFTNQWLYQQDADRFIGPGEHGGIYPLPAVGLARAIWQAPMGKTQAPIIAGQYAKLIFLHDGIEAAPAPPVPSQLSVSSLGQALGSFATGATITLPDGCTNLGILTLLANPPTNLAVTGKTTGGEYLIPTNPTRGIVWVKVAPVLDPQVGITFGGPATVAVFASFDESLVVAVGQGATEAPLAADGTDTPGSAGSIIDFTSGGGAGTQGAGLRGWLSLLKAYLNSLTHPLGALFPWPSVTLTITGGAAGAYDYRVYPLNAAGQPGTPTIGTTAAGPAALDATHFINVSWQPLPMALGGYQVYRHTGGATQGLIGTIAANNSGSLAILDNGLAASGAEPVTPPAPPVLTVQASILPPAWQAPTTTAFKDSGVGATATVVAGVAGKVIRLWGGQLSVLAIAAGGFVVLADSNNNQLLTLPADAKGLVAFNFGGAPLAAGAGLVVIGTGTANGRASAAVSQA